MFKIWATFLTFWDRISDFFETEFYSQSASAENYDYSLPLHPEKDVLKTDNFSKTFKSKTPREFTS